MAFLETSQLHILVQQFREHGRGTNTPVFSLKTGINVKYQVAILHRVSAIRNFDRV